MIIHRIKLYIDFKGIAVSKFENIIGASDGTIRNAIKNNKEINSKWLGLISDNFSDLNFNWLITGRGYMLLDNEVIAFENISNEAILDYILVHVADFRKEPKIDAVSALFSNFEQQRELQKMYDKIKNYESLLADKFRKED